MWSNFYLQNVRLAEKVNRIYTLLRACVMVLFLCLISQEKIQAAPPDSTCQDVCRTINPGKCRAVNTHKLNDQDWHVIDFSRPQSPLDILHFCMADSMDAVAAIAWMQKHNITEQCALRSFTSPLFYYYLTNGKTPKTNCRANGFIEEMYMGRYVYADPTCDTLPQMEFSKEDIVIKNGISNNDKSVKFFNGVFVQTWKTEDLNKFYCLMEKHQWNRFGVFYQYWAHDRPDTPFFMRFELEEE